MGDKRTKNHTRRLNRTRAADTRLLQVTPRPVDLQKERMQKLTCGADRSPHPFLPESVRAASPGDVSVGGSGRDSAQGGGVEHRAPRISPQALLPKCVLEQLPFLLPGTL